MERGVSFGLFEMPSDFAWGDYLYVVFKAGGEIHSTVSKAIYVNGKWVLPLPVTVEEVELIYVGPVESLWRQSSETQHASSKGVALGDSHAAGGNT